MDDRSASSEASTEAAERALRLTNLAGTSTGRAARAQALLAEGRVEAALAELEIALRENPEMAEGQLLAGLALARQRRFDLAIEPLALAAEFDDDPRWPNLALAVVHAQLEDFASALRAIDSQLQRDRHDAVAHGLRGAILARAGRDDEALAAFGRSLELDPGLADAHRRAAELLTARDEFARAEDHLRAAQHLAPSDPRVHKARAQWLRRQGKLEEATDAYRRAVQSGRPEAATLLDLGECCLEQHHYVEALLAARGALALAPKDSGARRLLARICAAEGRAAEGRLYEDAAARCEARRKAESETR